MTDPDAVSAHYDAIAGEYARLRRDELAARPLARAMLGVFAEVTRDAGLGPVADLGCGPGQVTAFLHALGVDIYGVDLSAEMVALARREHPGLRYERASMSRLGLGDGALGGIVAWYSVIHTPQEELGELFAEFHRLVRPGGHVLLAFQVGDAPPRREFGTSLEVHPLSTDRVVAQLEAVGLTIVARATGEPVENEQAPQAYLLARGRGAESSG
jgi:SAM-dependent methyltransferase